MDDVKSGEVIEEPATARPRLTVREEIVGYMQRNPTLPWGLWILVGLLLFSLFARLYVEDVEHYRPLSAGAFLSPSGEYPLGNDSHGRDLLAVNGLGVLNTLMLGLLAGLIGVGVATVLAFMAAYYGGWLDAVVRLVVDVGLTIPSLLIMVLIAIAVQGIDLWMMALVISSTSWLWPTRTIRSQVLTLKERAYVEVARLSGMRGIEIILKELVPNLLPFIIASLVTTTASAILASIGLEALGLGPPDDPTLGMTIHRVITYGGVIMGSWWWWLAPTILITLVFIALYLINLGTDELANPTLRRTA